MINYSNFTFNGWGLSKVALQFLEELIKKNNLEHCIEFGSGQSTKFLTEIGIDFISFEDDVNFAAPYSGVIIQDLVELDDSTYNKVISGEVRYIDVQSNFTPPVKKHTRQRNCFYSIPMLEFNKKFDLVILDGPNGNGRSIAFNYIKPHLNSVSYILIDDFTHHPYIENFKHTFPTATLLKEHREGRDEWCVYKIEK